MPSYSVLSFIDFSNYLLLYQKHLHSLSIYLPFKYTNHVKTKYKLIMSKLNIN